MHDDLSTLRTINILQMQLTMNIDVVHTRTYSILYVVSHKWDDVANIGVVKLATKRRM